MKKIAIITGVIATAATVQAKTPLNIQSENKDFETVQVLPEYKNEVKEGARTYTTKILKESDEEINDYTVFDKEVVVKKDLYAYSTQKISNDEITPEDENSILFLENVKFEEGAALNIRTNIDERINDFVNFHSVTLANGELLVKVHDSSTVPRFVKTPLFVLPAAAEHANVRLMRPVEISGVTYALKKQKIEDYMLFYIEPLYPSESIAEKFAMYENSMPKYKREYKAPKKNNYLREKITIVKEGRYIYSSNIVDLFSK